MIVTAFTFLSFCIWWKEIILLSSRETNPTQSISSMRMSPRPFPCFPFLNLARFFFSWARSPARSRSTSMLWFSSSENIRFVKRLETLQWRIAVFFLWFLSEKSNHFPLYCTALNPTILKIFQIIKSNHVLYKMKMMSQNLSDRLSDWRTAGFARVAILIRN